MTKFPAKPGRSEILIYQTDDGKTRIEVRLENETVWLSQKLMAELFQVSVPTVNEHIRNLYDEGELQARSNYSEIPNSSNGWRRRINHRPQGKHGRGKENEIVFRKVSLPIRCRRTGKK